MLSRVLALCAVLGFVGISAADDSIDYGPLPPPQQPECECECDCQCLADVNAAHAATTGVPQYRLQFHMFQLSLNELAKIGVAWPPESPAFAENGLADLQTAIEKAITTSKNTSQPLTPLQTTDIDGILEWLGHYTTVKILSDPTIVTTNGRDTSFCNLYGPPLRASNVDGERKTCQCGTTIDFTTTEKSSDLVQLKLNFKNVEPMDVDSAATADSNLPKVITNQCQTTVTLTTGKPFILGGLISMMKPTGADAAEDETRTETLIAVTADRFTSKDEVSSGTACDATCVSAVATEDMPNILPPPEKPDWFDGSSEGSSGDSSTHVQQASLNAPEAGRQILLHVSVLELAADKLQDLGIEEFGDLQKLKLFSPADLAKLQCELRKAATSDTSESTSENPTDFVQTLINEKLAKSVAQPLIVTFSGRPAQVSCGRELTLPGASLEESQSDTAFQTLGETLEVRPEELGNGNVRIYIRLRVTEPQSVQELSKGSAHATAFDVRACDTAIETKYGQPVAFVGPSLANETTLNNTDAANSVAHKTYFVVVSPERVDAISGVSE